MDKFLSSEDIKNFIEECNVIENDSDSEYDAVGGYRVTFEPDEERGMANWNEGIEQVEEEEVQAEKEEEPKDFWDRVMDYFEREEQKKKEQEWRTQEALERGFKEYMAKVRGF